MSDHDNVTKRATSVMLFDEIQRVNPNSILQSNRDSIISHLNQANVIMKKENKIDTISHSIELEIRIKDVEPNTFNMLELFMSKNYEAMKLDVEKFSYEVSSHHDKQKNIEHVSRKIQYINAKEPILMVKSKLNPIDNEMYDYRIGIAIENIVSKLQHKVDDVPIRKMERISYISSSDKVRIDLSRVSNIADDIDGDDEEETYLNSRSWEIELENMDPDVTAPIVLVRMDRWLKFLLAMVHESVYIQTVKQRRNLSREFHMTYLGKSIDYGLGISTEIFDKPIDLSLARDFSTVTAFHGTRGGRSHAANFNDEARFKMSQAHIIFLKTRGARTYLLFASDGIYSFHREFRFHKIFDYVESDIQPPAGMIVDGELLHLDENEYLPAAIVIHMNGLYFTDKVQSWYHMFDVVAYPGSLNATEHVKSNIISRLKELNNFLEPMKQTRIHAHQHFLMFGQVLSLHIKPYRQYNSGDHVGYLIKVNDALDEYYESLDLSRKELLLSGRFPSDGLIFSALNAPYGQTVGKGDKMISVTRKWKELDELTVDLIVRRRYLPGNKGEYELVPYVTTGRGNTLRIKRFIPVGSAVLPTISRATYTAEMEERLHDVVCEFKYNIDESMFEFLMERPDKFMTNTMSTVQALFNLYRDPITRETLTAQNLSMMRMYHNTAKSIYLKDARARIVPYGDRSGYQPKLLDIGTGNGAQVKTWRGKFDVVAIEPDPIRFEELKRRIDLFIPKDSKGPTVNAYQLDALRDANKIPQVLSTKWPHEGENSKADIISMIHSITFFYERDVDVNKLVDMIATNTHRYHGNRDNNRRGDGTHSTAGYFICMGIDGVKLAELLEEHGGSYVDEQERIFIRYANADSKRTINIRFNERGTARMSSLNTSEDGGQTEYLVDFDDLVMRLQHRGFTLISDRYLNNESFMSLGERTYSSMTRVIECRYDGMTKRETQEVLNQLGLPQINDTQSTITTSENDDSNSRRRRLRSGTDRSTTQSASQKVSQNNTSNSDSDNTPRLMRQNRDETVRRDSKKNFLALGEARRIVLDMNDLEMKRNIYEVGTHAGSSSLFHAVAQSADKEQYPMDNNSKDYIRNLRKQVASMLPESTDDPEYSTFKLDAKARSSKRLWATLRIWVDRNKDDSSGHSHVSKMASPEDDGNDDVNRINVLFKAIRHDIAAYTVPSTGIAVYYLMKHYNVNIYILTKCETAKSEVTHNNMKLEPSDSVPSIVYDEELPSVVLLHDRVTDQYSIISTRKDGSLLAPSSTLSKYLYASS